MLRWAVSICLVMSPLVIIGSPPSAIPSRYETEQDYTDSPDAKIVSSYPEIQTEKSVPAKQLKSYKPRGRSQQQYPNQQQQQYQSQEQYQQYQADYRTPAQPQSTSPPSVPQYEQQNQYEPHYINQAKYLQQSAHHEHSRPSTTTYIPIIRLEKTQALDGTYQQNWETGNHIIASENGYFKHISDDQDALVQTGNYSYTAPDGSLVWTSYTADEGGFKVTGSHIPTPPPIPEEIRRGLQQIYEGIRLQQEAEAREAKSGKKKPISDEENSITPENYPPQFRYQQQPQQQQQHQQQQQQQYRQQQPQQYPQQQSQQPQQYQEQPQTYRPIVAQPFRKVQKVQRPQGQQYQSVQASQQFPESQRIPQNQEPSQSEQ